MTAGRTASRGAEITAASPQAGRRQARHAAPLARHGKPVAARPLPFPYPAPYPHRHGQAGRQRRTAPGAPRPAHRALYRTPSSAPHRTAASPPRPHPAPRPMPPRFRPACRAAFDTLLTGRFNIGAQVMLRTFDNFFTRHFLNPTILVGFRNDLTPENRAFTPLFPTYTP